MDSESRSWSDPSVFDAPLTQRGHSQAAALREPLAKMVAKRGVRAPLRLGALVVLEGRMADQAGWHAGWLLHRCSYDPESAPLPNPCSTRPAPQSPCGW